MAALTLSLIVLKTLLFSSMFSFTSLLVKSSFNADLDFIQPDPFCSTDSNNCLGSVDYSFSILADIGEDLQVTYQLKMNDGPPLADNYGTLSGSGLDYSINGSYPIGDHNFLVTIQEMDGTISTGELPFSVVDCLAPMPFCINGLAVELLPTEPGSEESLAHVVYVEDVLAMLSNDCSGPVTYSINLTGEEADPNQDSIFLGCCMPETLIVEVWAWDNANNPYAIQPDGTIGGSNADFCETYILIQDNIFNFCDCDPMIATLEGDIKTFDNVPVAGVDVILSGDASATTITDVYGGYAFEGLEAGRDYTVAPFKNNDPLNGVTTLDLILISKHILNIASLNSPYKILAADANNSGSVTTLDLIIIKKVILSIEEAFPNNTSWQFVNKAYVFPDPNNPWAESIPEVFNINNISDSVIEQNFIAIKTGDVNGSAQ